MNCDLVMDDWRRIGENESIYNTAMGVELSTGDLHCGSTFVATVHLPDDVAREITEAFEQHRAYPVFRLVPVDESEEPA